VISSSNRITCFEDLSNELFHEVFDYLEGCAIYKAFFKLNSRFKHLIIHSSLPLKIKFYSSSQSKLKHYINNYLIPNRHNIISLYFKNQSLIDDLFIHCIIDSSFNRLESIVLDGITSKQIMILLFYLRSLPRLFSLKIQLNDEWEGDLGDIYRLIFSLPSMKFNRLTFEVDIHDLYQELDISVPFAINERFSTIEYLIINHNCTSQELFSIVRHTPRLRHLTCERLVKSGITIDTNKPVILFNLTHLCLDDCAADFDEFKLFITKVSSQLQVLKIQQYTYEDYLDVDRCQRLIKNYMPHLRKFDYEYHDIDPFYQGEDFVYMKMNRFISPFWIERQWFFEATIIDHELIYSIHLHRYNKRCILLQKIPCFCFRKMWFDNYEYTDINTCSNQSSKPKQHNIDKSSTQLIIDTTSIEINQTFIDTFKVVFDTVQFTHLNINNKEIHPGILSKIIQLLPNLVSLKVSSVQLTHPNCLGDNFNEFLLPTSITNKITFVYLENTADMGQVDFLLALCRCVQHFQVHVPKTLYLDMFLRFIFIKSKTLVHRLRSLCLCIPHINEDIIHHIQNLIELEKVLSNCMIKHRGNNIHLTWN
jgi:hypothetical protein